MRWAILISLVLHVAVVASVVWGTERGGKVGAPSMRAYTVNIVGLPGGQGWFGAPGPKGGAKRPSAPTPKTDVVRERARTGLKVTTAPSNEPMAPKGTKKPARSAGQKPGQEGSSGGRGGGQPGGGGGGLRLEEGEPFPFPDYLNNLQRRIEEHWEEPLIVGKQGTLKATVFFRILRDGTITDFKVEVGSGLLSFDRAALDAVIGASPLPPLPDGFRGDQLGVHFDFEY